MLHKLQTYYPFKTSIYKVCVVPTSNSVPKYYYLLINSKGIFGFFAAIC